MCIRDRFSIEFSGCIGSLRILQLHSVIICTMFPPAGKDYLTQVKLVLGLLGTPSEAVLKNCQSDVLRRIIKSECKRLVFWSITFFSHSDAESY